MNTTAISELIDGVRKAYQQDQIDKGMRSSGKSAASLRIDVKENSGTLYGAKYFYQQIHGRKPGKFPPIDEILNWIRIKGIQARDNKTTTRQLAFLFARKIAERGTDIFSGKKKGLNVDDKIKVLVKEFTANFSKELKTKLSTGLKIILIALLPSLCQAQKSYHALEASYITLNTFDVISTYQVLKHGGEELNPVMAKFVDNKAAFIGAKVITTGTFLWACRVIKKDNKKAAYALLIAGNLFYGALVTNNYIVSVRLKI